MVAAGAAVAVTAIRARRRGRRRSIELSATTTVRRPRPEVYAFWRRWENLPSFMTHLDDVVVLDERRSRWQARAPLGRAVTWTAELTRDERNTRMDWRSVGRTAVPNSGSVTFATAPDGISTEVQVRLRYDLPGGRAGAVIARAFGEEPHQQVDDDLRRFKQVMETGDVVRSDGQPWGKRARHEFPQRPAQPLRIDELFEVVVA